MANEAVPKILGGVACTILVIGVILFSVSFDTLSPTQVGIRFDNNFMSIQKTRVYHNGRYFLGLGQSFIKFDTSAQLVEYKGRGALQTWSREGQIMILEVSFYYQIQREHVLDIYLRYDHTYHARLSQIAMRILKQVTVLYTGEQFFTQRAAIGQHMKTALRARLKEEFCDLVLFSLRDISIPAKFETKIIQKLVKEQEVQTEQNKRDIAVLRAAIDVIRGEGQANITRTLAQASANAVKTVENAKSIGENQLRTQESISLGLLRSVLGLEADDLLRYRYAQLPERMEETSVVNRTMQFIIGFDSPVLTVKAN